LGASTSARDKRDELGEPAGNANYAVAIIVVELAKVPEEHRLVGGDRWVPESLDGSDWMARAQLLDRDVERSCDEVDLGAEPRSTGFPLGDRTSRDASGLS
jgi:hypothetical protein